EGDRDADEQDGRRGDQEADDPRVRGGEPEDEVHEAGDEPGHQPEEAEKAEKHEQDEQRDDDPSRRSQAPPRLGQDSRLVRHPYSAIYLSTPPMIGSRLAMIAIVSAMRLPGSTAPTPCRFTKLGSWRCMR